MRTRTILSTLALLGLAACGAQDHGESAAPAVATVDAPANAAAVQPAHELRTEAGEGTVYLDVRRQDERAAGYIAGSLHIPVEELAARWQELEPYRDRDIVVYCRTGRRSANAIRLLSDHGFGQLSNGGGLTDMTARGLPLTR